MTDDKEKDYDKEELKKERDRLDKMGAKSTFNLLTKSRKEEDD